MERWEYLEIHVHEGNWVDSMRRHGVLPRIGHPAHPYASSQFGMATTGPLLNELGEQGWEVTGVASVGFYTYKLFLKRPKR